MKKWNSYLKPPKDGETYEAHHLNMIKLISRIVNGLNLEQRTAVYKHLKDVTVYLLVTTHVIKLI